jgi:hypothetical protein
VVVRENAWKTKKTETTLLSRPAGFDPERNAQQGHYRFMSYELEYNTRRRRMCDNIAGLTEAIAWLTARYDSWRAPDAQD